MTTLALAGDVMLGRGVNDVLAKVRPEEPWGDLLALLRSCDARIVNLECAITASTVPWRRWPKVFHFRAEPSRALPVLRAAGIDACCLANNHVLDFEVEGLFDTLSHLDAARIAHAGAGRTLEEAQQPALVDAAGATIALLAFTDNEPGWAAREYRSGVAFLEPDVTDEALWPVADGVAASRLAGADLVVLSLHWGPNMVERPPARFRAFARAAIELGVDVVHGHSAHVVQGVEVHRGRPILYDCGDFLDDYAIDPVLRNDRSFLFTLHADGGRPTALELHPAILDYAHVSLARGEEADAILDRMQRLSSELGTTLERSADRLLLTLGEPLADGAGAAGHA